MITSKVLRTITTRSLCKTADKSASRTAGIIIIGDEILKGDVTDTNSTFLVKKLYNLGVRVKKISVIGDEIDEICSEVRHFSSQFTYVITSGGIGPTHDDVTFEAVAKAFNEPLIAHPILVNICSQYYDTKDLSCPGMKLANIPKSARLTFGEQGKKGAKVTYPNVSVNNVYIFPGIPQLLEKLFNHLGAKLFLSDQKFFKKIVYFNVTEKLLVTVLNQLVKEFPDVIFGSYPVLENSLYKVKVTIEATQEALILAAHKKMMELLPREYIVDRNI